MSETVLRWSSTQVQELAPDPASLTAARKLAGSGKWSESGCAPAVDDPDSAVAAAVWGLCQGSGSKPYQTCVDLAEPAYRCSCPSRKFPCKHALALLVRFADGTLAEAARPDWVTQWQSERSQRAARKATQAVHPRTEAQDRAAAKRAADRADRVSAGLSELEQWLSDQIRHGLAGLDQAGYRHFDQVAARLVDAQAPGLAAAVRRLAPLPSSGPGWEHRLLAELGMLRLLVGAAQRVETLPAPLADTVNIRLGQSVTTDQVLAGPRVRDVWQVTATRDDSEDKLASRRVWLRGLTSGRDALVLSYAAPGQALPVDLTLAMRVDAELCFYPSAPPLRALVAARHGSPRGAAGRGAPAARPEATGGPSAAESGTPAATPGATGSLPASGAVLTGEPVAAALDRIADVLAGDPWLTSWPLLIEATVVPGDVWHLVDAAGDALPFASGLPRQGGNAHWSMVAAAGGRPVTIAAEWHPSGVRPLTMFTGSEVVAA